MDHLVHKLQLDHPALVFKVGEAHCWSPQRGEILYEAADTEANIAGVLHELGHARLGHQRFASDIELLQKEVDAWQEALRLAERYGLAISEEHIQDCLDTYRDWLYRRSRCPGCESTGVQQTVRRYLCVNCSNTWEVSSSRLRRPYRQQTARQGTAQA
jgi:hypothetical protein